MLSSILSNLNRRSTIVVASAGVVAACAASTVAAALPDDHTSAKPAAAVASATALPVPAVQTPQTPQAQLTEQPQAAQPQQDQQAASRSEERVVLASTTDTSPAGLQALAKTIVPADQFASFSNIVMHESSWNYLATNPSSGSYGLGQALPASKMASEGADWRTNPLTQIKWTYKYMNERYGSPNQAWVFWQNHHWY